MRVGSDGLLEAVEEQAAVAGPAAVEAEGELVEVEVELVVADGALVGSGIATCAGSPDAETLVTAWLKRFCPTPL